MCQFKSMLILKDRVFVPDYDSHEDMLSELRIKDDMLNAQKTFVRAELLPKDDDVFSDIGTWEFHIDQDIRPDWFDENTDRERAVDAVKEWAKKHVRIDEDGIRITDGIYYIKNCKDVAVLNNSTVTAWDNSTVTAWDNSTVTARDNSTVTAQDNSTVTAWNNSTVIARNNSTVTARDNSTVIAQGNSTVTAWDNSTVTAWNNSTVTARDNSTVTAWNNSTVTAQGNSTVTAWDNSTVKNSIYSKWLKKDEIILHDNAIFRDIETKTIYHTGGWKLAEAVK